MNIVDALVVTFGIDASEYEKKQKEIATSLTKMGEVSGKQTKLIAESGKKAAGAFSALKIEVLGALAAFGMGAGFKSFIESSMNAQASAGRTAGALGVSVQSMRAYKLMAKEMGESGDAAVGTLQKVAAGMAAARRGDTTFIANANKYGAGITLDDNVETVMSKLNKMAYAIKQKYGEQQAIGVLGEVGVSDQLQAIRLTQDPAKNAREHAEAMRKVGFWSPQQIAQNDKAQEQWADLLQLLDNLKVEIENKILPYLIKLGNQFEAWVNSGGMDRLTTKLEKIFDEVQKVVSALGGVKGILIEIAAIKVFGWALSIASTILKLRALTTALLAARAAAAAGGAAGAAEGAAAAGGAGLAAKVIPLATRVSVWALPVWALFHSESTGGKRRADGTYEDEPDVNDPKNKAAWDRYMANKKVDMQARGIRNNNPGNIKYGAFAKRMGATGADSGGFAIFRTAADGIAAISANLASYGRKGFDTPSEIAHRWSTTDQAAYTQRLAALFGGNPNQKLDMTDPKVLRALSSGIIMQENGANPYAALVQSGAYVGAKPTASTTSHQSTNTNTVTINGPINVQTKATDAPGIAKAMGRSLRNHPLIAGSVTALA
jgi:hypothetical protein